MIAHAPRPARRTPPSREDPASVAIRPTPGRSLVTARALRDIVRLATIGSYGVTGFAGRPGGVLGRLVERLGFDQPGLTVRIDDGIDIDLDLTIALGVPVAEVARQVDSAVRYAVRQALDRDVARIAIHIDGLHVPTGGAAPPIVSATPADAVRPRDLADSGTDVA